MPATISPDVRSLLIRAAAAAGGDVHAEVTSATCGDLRSWSTMSVPADLAAALSTPSGVETTTSSCTSPCPNLSVSICVARDDSAVGSWNPLGDRCLATGTPKMPRTIASSAAATMTARGAAMASRAIRCSRRGPPSGAHYRGRACEAL
jgi:hypothetical protein